MRGSGQWGLLGGSSNPGKSTTKPKPSKLANLARSSRGAFDNRETKQQTVSSRLDSVSRLASLNTASRSQQLPVDSNLAPRTEPLPILVNDDVQADISKPSDVNPFTDPSADLLALPSLLASSLFRLWVVPEDVASSLLRIYANPYFLIVANETQLRKAFSTSSPDDAVRSAQLRGKGI